MNEFGVGVMGAYEFFDDVVDREAEDDEADHED